MTPIPIEIEIEIEIVIVNAINAMLAPYGERFSPAGGQPTRNGYLNWGGAVKYTGLSKSTLQRAVKSGELKAPHKMANWPRFSVASPAHWRCWSLNTISSGSAVQFPNSRPAAFGVSFHVRAGIRRIECRDAQEKRRQLLLRTGDRRNGDGGSFCRRRNSLFRSIQSGGRNRTRLHEIHPLGQQLDDHSGQSARWRRRSRMFLPDSSESGPRLIPEVSRKSTAARPGLLSDFGSFRKIDPKPSPERSMQRQRRSGLFLRPLPAQRE